MCDNDAARAEALAATGKVSSIGCVVPGLDAPLLLSCWHVLYGISGRDGDVVVQPSPSGILNDIGENRVGIITERVDCAVAEVNSSRVLSPTILGIPMATM